MWASAYVESCRWNLATPFPFVLPLKQAHFASVWEESLFCFQLCRTCVWPEQLPRAWSASPGLAGQAHKLLRRLRRWRVGRWTAEAASQHCTAISVLKGDCWRLPFRWALASRQRFLQTLSSQAHRGASCNRTEPFPGTWKGFFRFCAAVFGDEVSSQELDKEALLRPRVIR